MTERKVVELNNTYELSATAYVCNKSKYNHQVMIIGHIILS